MSSKSKMVRMVMHNRAQRLSQNGKRGKSDKIFKTLMQGYGVVTGKTSEAKAGRKQPSSAEILEKIRKLEAERKKG